MPPLKIVAFLFLALSFFACKTEAQDNSVNQEENVFQTLLDSVYKANPASVGLMVHIESPNNNFSWTGCAGKAEKNSAEALQCDQPALIASNIKTYVAATILRLQELGKLSVHDTIAHRLSAETLALFEEDGYNFHEIQIKHLLSHTSGIEDYANDTYLQMIDTNIQHRWTREEQLKLAVQLGDPIGAAQDVFSYADANYLLATEIIEQVYGQPFYTAMRELLQYSDLALEHTWFPILEDKPAATKERVHQYWDEMNWDSQEHDISWDLYGGGGIATTTEELAKFIYALFNGSIIKEDSILQLLSKPVPTHDGVDNHYGLGLSLNDDYGMQAYGHGGFWGTVVLYFPELETSISVFVLEKDQAGLRKDIMGLMLQQLKKEIKSN